MSIRHRTLVVLLFASLFLGFASFYTTLKIYPHIAHHSEGIAIAIGLSGIVLLFGYAAYFRLFNN